MVGLRNKTYFTKFVIDKGLTLFKIKKYYYFIHRAYLKTNKSYI